MTKNIEYEAVIKVNGEIKGRVQSYDLNGLDAQLYKLGKVQDRLEDDNLKEFSWQN